MEITHSPLEQLIQHYKPFVEKAIKSACFDCNQNKIFLVKSEERIDKVKHFQRIDPNRIVRANEYARQVSMEIANEYSCPIAYVNTHDAAPDGLFQKKDGGHFYHSSTEFMGNAASILFAHEIMAWLTVILQSKHA